MKIKDILSYVLCCLFCLVMVIDYSIPGMRIIKAYRLVSVVICFLAIWYVVINPNRKKGHSLKFSIIMWSIIVCGCVISMIGTASFQMNNVEYLMCYLYYPIVFGALAYNFRNKTSARNMLAAYYTVSIGIAILGYYETFTGDIIHVTPGAYVHLRNFLGLHLPNTIFYNINDNAVFMMMSLIVAYIFSEYVKHGTIIKLIALILYGGNIVFVDSRGAEMALAAFLLLYYLIRYRAGKKILVVGILAISGAVLYPFIMQFSVFSEGISNTGRSLIWMTTARNIMKHPFIGVGPGNIVDYNRMMGTSGIVYAVHNYLLEIMADLGVIVAIVWCVWFGILLFKAYQIRRVNTSLVVLCGLIAFVPMSIVCSSLIEKHWPILFFGILVTQLNMDEKN